MSGCLLMSTPYTYNYAEGTFKEGHSNGTIKQYEAPMQMLTHCLLREQTIKGEPISKEVGEWIKIARGTIEQGAIVNQLMSLTNQIIR